MRTFSVPLLLLLLAGCSRGDAGDDHSHSQVLLEPKGVELVDQTGRPFKLDSLRGQRALIFFGYTRCPDVCPMTMSKLARAYAIKGNKGDPVRTLFISVDPRDNPTELAQYMSYFTAIPATGLTGTKAQIDHAVKQFAARYEIVPSNSAVGFLVNHTSAIFLLDADGKVRKIFRHDDRAEAIAHQLRQS